MLAKKIKFFEVKHIICLIYKLYKFKFLFFKFLFLLFLIKNFFLLYKYYY